MIGFLIENANDQNMLNAINTLNSMPERIPCIVFSETAIPNLQCNVLQKIEAFHFNGTIITDTIRLAQQVANLGYTKKRYLYLKEYDWMQFQDLYLSQLEDTLLNPHIDLIINNVNQTKIVTEITNKKPKYIMQNWDINILRSIANE